LILNLNKTLFIFNFTNASKNFDVERCEDEKCFKNLLKTRPNLLICFAKIGNYNLYALYNIIKQEIHFLFKESEAKEPLKLFRDVSQSIKGTATVALIDCE
jgi:hypothetical protein